MPRPSRSSLFLAFALSSPLFAAGCGHPAARALEGRWFGDSVENFDSRDVAAATGWARGASMEFSGSQITVAIPAEDAHENDLVLAFKDEKGAVTKAKFQLDGDHYFKWKLDERRSIVMRREQ
jgi:hypothetical protein